MPNDSEDPNVPVLPFSAAGQTREGPAWYILDSTDEGVLLARSTWICGSITCHLKAHGRGSLQNGRSQPCTTRRFLKVIIIIIIIINFFALILFQFSDKNNTCGQSIRKTSSTSWIKYLQIPFPFLLMPEPSKRQLNKLRGTGTADTCSDEKITSFLLHLHALVYVCSTSFLKH